MIKAMLGRVFGLLLSVMEAVLVPLLMPLIEAGYVPDFLVRFGIRRLNEVRLRDEGSVSIEAAHAKKMAFVEKLKTMPIAINTDDANDQHYEVPAAAYELMLGPWLKYSCGYWPKGCTTLKESEEAMLSLYMERARVEDGMHIMDLGCGWGSVTLWAATHFPKLRITSLSNSKSQKAFIMAKAKALGVADRIQVHTCDINKFDTDPDQFDRIISIEMFEHMKNYELLLGRVSRWLKDDGYLFIHIFTHKDIAYSFEAEPGSAAEWMANNFFTGGTMPSDDLLLYFARDVHIVDHWRVDGTHYEKTSNAWLEKLDRHSKTALEVFKSAYGEGKEARWLQAWRLFYLACAELFGYSNGQEWLVSHYLFGKGQSPAGLGLVPLPVSDDEEDEDEGKKDE